MNKKFKPARMVNWFHPAVLAQSGLKLMVSKLFGNYADRRETQAALDDPEANKLWHAETQQYTEREEIWIDYISDTGDGFNSTYSVASLAAQDVLHLESVSSSYTLPRAKIMVLGGDQIYPTPTSELYHNNFRIPFASALPRKNSDDDHPHLYAIPGNHDWYDGLGNFLKVFCQQRWIGNWKTQQLRSYFAIPLPHNYWLWATDIQLNEDIDMPQQNYFRDVARHQMKQGDKVILCTAEPAWFYQELYPANTSFERLSFFIENYISKDKSGSIGKTFRLAVVLSGDMHHYSHYSDVEMARSDMNSTAHYIGAGGGGAFTHLSHRLPVELSKIKSQHLKLRATFPGREQSAKLVFRNLAFVKNNTGFSFLLGVFYLLFFWILRAQVNAEQDGGIQFLELLKSMDLSGYAIFCARAMLNNPLLIFLAGINIYGFRAFTDTRTGIRGIRWWGSLHGVIQLLCVPVMLWLLSKCIPYKVPDLPETVLVGASLLICGTLIGGSLMGIYLILSDLLFKIHVDEVASALSNEDYKNFLRMHITKDELTIYPIGIKNVTKNWKIRQNAEDDKYEIEGKLPQAHLIEEPIVIKLN